MLIDAIADENNTFLFSRTEHHLNDNYINLFSVLAQSEYPTIKNQVIVEHTGSDNGDGEWRCFKDARMVTCPHILRACHFLQKFINADPSATDRNIDEGLIGTYPSVGPTLTKHAAVNESGTFHLQSGGISDLNESCQLFL
jgi:hypothetical protein